MCDIITKFVTVFNTDLRHIFKICQIRNNLLVYAIIIHFTMSPRVKKSMSREGRAPSRPFAPPLGRTISIAVISIPAIICVRRKRYPHHCGKSKRHLFHCGKIRAIVGKAVGRNLPQNTLNGQRPSLNTQNVLGACRVPKFSVFSVPRDAPWTGRSIPHRQEAAQGKSSG